MNIINENIINEQNIINEHDLILTVTEALENMLLLYKSKYEVHGWCDLATILIRYV